MIFEQEIVYEDGYAALDELCGYLLTAGLWYLCSSFHGL